MDLEPILGLATILGGIAAIWFFLEKFDVWICSDTPQNDNDLRLYEQYRELFITTGVAEFYGSHDFMGAFDVSFWKPYRSMWILGTASIMSLLTRDSTRHTKGSTYPRERLAKQSPRIQSQSPKGAS